MSRTALRRYFRHGLFPQLVVFEAVARLGSVTRAAEELHLAQPTVSMQLKKLAHTLELRLFQPDGRRLRITPAGESLLALCRELLELFRRAEERLAPFRGNGHDDPRLAAEREAREIASRLFGAFVREARRDDAYNSAQESAGDESEAREPWKSRASTTRR